MSRYPIIFLLFCLLIAAKTTAQPMPLSGTHFTFGIPEGPDELIDPFLSPDTSKLSLNIIGAYDGKGIITSPSGYCKEFSFTSNTVTTIALPYSLMHLKDLGKTNKGLLIRTSQPVNVVFHDYLEAAGEATQIYPDQALGTDYRITSWGIFNDIGEDNNSQFLVTAVEDNTDVTIVPSVKTLGNNPALVPIRITLNRGECYIIKADINSAPSNISLTNSTVVATKPVSVIIGVTCAYVPLNKQSCNEIIDEIVPRAITGTTFYVAPLRDQQVLNTVLFSSDTPDFFVLTTGGTNYQSTNGRVEIQITTPQMFTLTAPAQCFLLSDGSEVEYGDPSIVTVLPQDKYVDSLLWYTPSFSFDHYVSVIYPKSSEGSVMLDGLPLASVANPQLIPGSPMAAAVAVIKPGAHRITSPVPIFALASGFSIADSYSFMPGTISPKLPVDTTQVFLGISTTQAKTCREFDATITASFHKEEDISSVDLIVNYDPAILTLVSVQLGPVAQGGQWVTDTRIPGTILISATCLHSFTDSGAIAFVKFSTGPSVTTTTLSGNIKVTGGESVYGARKGITKTNISIQEIRDTLAAQFSLSVGAATLGDVKIASLSVSSLPNILVDEIDLFVTYDHDVLNLVKADLANSVASAGVADIPISIDPTTEEIKIHFAPATALNSGILAKLIFETYISVSKNATVTVRGSVLNSRPCPLDILAAGTTDNFAGIDTCGTSTLRSFMRNEPFKINSIIPNPSKGSFTIDLDRHLFGNPLHISLVDVLGNEVWKTEYSSDYINQKIPCSVGSSLSAGSYFLRISMPGHTETQKVVIRN